MPSLMPPHPANASSVGSGMANGCVLLGAVVSGLDEAMPAAGLVPGAVAGSLPAMLPPSSEDVVGATPSAMPSQEHTLGREGWDGGGWRGLVFERVARTLGAAAQCPTHRCRLLV